ncbi:hypothetical protein JCM10207_005468 [Rhodosporidiobolus poonsookiae]
MLSLPFSLLALSSALLAHAANVSLVYPAPRAANTYTGMEEGSCLPRALDNATAPWRIPFPLNSTASVVIQADRDVENLRVAIAFGENPVTFGAVGGTAKYPNGTEEEFFSGLYRIDSAGEGRHCYAVNTNTLMVGEPPTFGNLTDGEVGRLNVVYSVNGTFESICSDIVLVANYSLPSNSSCDVVNGGRATASVLGSVQLIAAGLLSVCLAAFAL